MFQIKPKCDEQILFIMEVNHIRPIFIFIFYLMVIKSILRNETKTKILGKSSNVNWS